jgi:kynureninase
MSIKTMDYAIQYDGQDELSRFRSEFHIPKNPDGSEIIYMCGNSLGLQPKRTKEIVNRELERWADLAVEGHFKGESAWTRIHKLYAPAMAKIVGAKDTEVTLMNTLTTNLHLLLATFYRPKPSKNKILVEYNLFPSDRYALQSQIEWHGYSFEDALIELKPNSGSIITQDEIAEYIEKYKDELALIIIGGVNYFSGQFYDIPYLSTLAKKYNIPFGLDLAHAAGNIPLKLHDWDVDFAVWCNYKYLNGGPGAIAGAYVHEKHHSDSTFKLKGWYGYEEKNRFLMTDYFVGEPDVNSWQLSNQPVLSLVTLEASLQLFEEAGMDKLRAKSIRMTTYLSSLIQTLDGNLVEQLTPSDPGQRGCQLSIKLKNGDRSVFNAIREDGILPDWRNPNVIRFSPVPLYNSFMDCYKAFLSLKNALGQ